MINPLEKEGTLYAIMAERDGPYPGGRPIIWEQYMDKGAASLEKVRERASFLANGRYGKIWICEVTIMEEV